MKIRFVFVDYCYLGGEIIFLASNMHCLVYIYKYLCIWLKRTQSLQMQFIASPVLLEQGWMELIVFSKRVHTVNIGFDKFFQIGLMLKITDFSSVSHQLSPLNMTLILALYWTQGQTAFSVTFFSQYYCGPQIYFIITVKSASEEKN